MKVLQFKYTKNSGEESDRNVLQISSTKTYIDTIDLTKLTDEEIKEVKEIYKEYEKKIEPYIKKGFRRFTKDNMSKINEEVE